MCSLSFDRIVSSKIHYSVIENVEALIAGPTHTVGQNRLPDRKEGAFCAAHKCGRGVVPHHMQMRAGGLIHVSEAGRSARGQGSRAESPHRMLRCMVLQAPREL